MEKIKVKTRKRFEFLNITPQVEETVEGKKEGAVNLFCPHTTAALVCNEENAGVKKDFETVLNRLVPSGLNYKHLGEGEKNARAHQLAMLLGGRLIVPVEDGKLKLGTWQSLFLVELLEPRRREVWVWFS